MPRVLLSPKIDFVFKKIFGNEKHPEILISFLKRLIIYRGRCCIMKMVMRNEKIHFHA